MNIFIKLAPTNYLKYYIKPNKTLDIILFANEANKGPNYGIVFTNEVT